MIPDVRQTKTVTTRAKHTKFEELDFLQDGIGSIILACLLNEYTSSYMYFNYFKFWREALPRYQYLLRGFSFSLKNSILDLHCTGGISVRSK